MMFHKKCCMIYTKILAEPLRKIFFSIFPIEETWGVFAKLHSMEFRLQADKKGTG